MAKLPRGLGIEVDLNAEGLVVLEQLNAYDDDPAVIFLTPSESRWLLAQLRELVRELPNDGVSEP